MVSNSSVKQLSSARRRIILLTIFAILSTGIAVGLSSSLPMYNSVRLHIEQANITGANSHTSALDNQFERFESLAAQFTSRTEIRKRLEAYHNQELSLEAVQEFSQPRLEEPASHIPDLALMIRVDIFGIIIAKTGNLSSRVDELDLTPSGLRTVNLDEENHEIYIRVAAPIFSSKKEIIGWDILYFYPESIKELLSSFGTFGSKAKLFIANRQHQKALAYNNKNDSIERTIIPDNAFNLLQRENPQPFLTQMKIFDNDRVVINIPLKNPEWSLSISVPKGVFYSAAYQDLQWSIITIFGLLFLGLILSHYSVNPLIKRLVRQAEKIERSSMELRLAASVFERIKEPIIISDEFLTITRINPGFMEFTASSPKDFIGKNLMDLMLADPAGDETPRPNDILRQMEQSESWVGEVWYKFQNSVVPILQTTTAVTNEKNKTIYYIHLLKDISKQKNAEKEMSKLANYDALTGLPNRRALHLNLQQVMDDHQSADDCFALMFIDLDKFKPVNDTYGHQVGDILLKEVSNRIKNSVRHADVVGRLGGDEFLLIATSLSKPIFAQRLAQKLIDYLSEPFEVEGLVLKIGASIGIAYYPYHGTNPAALIEVADQAMYQAKEGGRNRFYEAPLPEGAKIEEA